MAEEITIKELLKRAGIDSARHPELASYIAAHVVYAVDLTFNEVSQYYHARLSILGPVDIVDNETREVVAQMCAECEIGKATFIERVMKDADAVRAKGGFLYGQNMD